MNIGLDFGTTNSILSFYNRNNDYVDTYKLDTNGGENYIPSVVAIEDEDIYIGKSAKGMIADDDICVYSKFKILLNLRNKDSLNNQGYFDKTPEEVTTIYLQELLNKFKLDNSIEKIDSLVLTIPEIWLKDDHISRTTLKKIVKNLNLPLKKLVSEPVAAGAYFLHNYEKVKAKKFDGHVLVFDYGGGTLDVSLLHTQNNTIRVLERTGKGKDEKFIGSAGVAFDEKVIVTMCGEQKSKLGKKYKVLLNQFEQRKIDSSVRHEKNILKYIEDNSINKKIFDLTCMGENGDFLGEYDITASNLVNAFKDLNKDIVNTLSDIEKTFFKHNVKSQNSDKFRVVMVGGFSNFYLSKRSVKEFFRAADNDSRFETHFKADDIALAISKGAALIAEDVINIDETYPISLGLVVKMKNNKGEVDGEEQYISIFKQGDIVKTHEITYINKRISQAGQLIFSINTGSKQSSFKIRINKDIKQLYPNFTKENNRWKLGFSIDDNSFIYVYIKDKYDDVTKTELGDILNEYSDAIIFEYEEGND